MVQFLADAVHQLGTVDQALRRDTDRLAEAELDEFAGLRNLLRAVGLIGDQDDIQIVFADELGDLGIQRHHALADIDHKNDHIGRRHGLKNLVLDMLFQRVAIDDAVAAGIDQLKIAVVPVDDRRNAVARHPGGRIDNTDHLTG